MEKLIFSKNQTLNIDDINFIINTYDTYKKGGVLLLFYNQDLMFIKNDYNKIKILLQNILTSTIEDYKKYLYNINFYNIVNYNHGNNSYKLIFIEICLSTENNNNIRMLANNSYSAINFIFCLDDLFIKFFNKNYPYKIGDLILFPCGWSFYYKIEVGKRYIHGHLFS